MSEMTEAADVKLLYLPPYGSDSNPIKMDFSKLKASLQKAASTPKPISRMLSD
jgi:transposase